ncbi:MAG: FtsW/RodA/SpoVE family cell cycle protein [Patescibacteria group bacterium]
MKVIDRFLNLDFFILGAIGIITSISVLSIYSSAGMETAARQAFFVGSGILIYFILSFFDWRILKENSLLVLGLYLLSTGLLIGLLLFGPKIRNVQRWFRIGPIMVSPAEFAKLTLIILLAKYFSMRHVELYKIRHIILSGIYAFIPTYLIFRQPDMGTAAIFLVLWGGILLISGIKLRHFLALSAIGIVSLGLVWGFLMQDYQKDRVISFINPQFDPQGIGWGGNHAKIAIGNGGLLGTGLGEGTQTQYGFLPEPHTDFIFAAIAEEMGFLTVSLLIFAFGILFWRMFKIIFNTKFNFPRLFVSGFLIIVMFQSFVNIGMNLGLLPIMGTPLPFVTYGGSSTLFFFTGLGIVESMRYNNN